MRTQQAVDSWNEANATEMQDDEFLYYSSCYESCIPRSMWDVSSDTIAHNLPVFRKIVLKYCAKRKKVQKLGWGLMFTGDNGTGKTTFISFVLSQMIRRGCSAYYTTLSQLDKDIKSGFGDKVAERRLDHFLDSDFLAIDELGKEHYKADSFINMRLEMLLKQRCDDGDPTLLGTNLDYNGFCEMYGPSIASIVDGKYVKATMVGGDFRKIQSARVHKELGL
jgi:DNA replication protein DnaC